MFLRFVKALIRPERANDFEQHYAEHIKPELERTPGCLFAALMRTYEEPIEAVSMTIWDTRYDAERYERSGVYRSMIDQGRPFILETEAWRMKLEEEDTVFNVPAPVEPEVTAFPIQTGDPDEIPELPATSESGHYYLRVVSLRVLRGEVYRLAKIYEEEITPRLLQVDGCRNAFLARGHSDPEHALSITLWDSAEQANAYEKSGVFDELHELIRPLLSSKLEWRMALDPGRPAEPEAGELDVHGWQVVSSKQFATVNAER